MRDPDWLDDDHSTSAATREPRWVDDDTFGAEPSRRRPRPLLIVLAAVPWLVVVALFVVPDQPTVEPVHDPSPHTAPDDSAAADETSPTAARDPVVTPSATDAARAGPGVTPSHTDSAPAGPTVTPPEPDTAPAGPVLAPSNAASTHADLAAVALLAARRWLSGADHYDDDLALTARDDSHYAEHLHLEGFDGDQELLVARVVALILDVDAARAPQLQRIAVPLATTPDGPRLLGEPWELPSPTLEVVTLPTETLTDPVVTEAARNALLHAGFTSPRVQRLARTAGWPLVVTFTADDRIGPRQVWLDAAPDGVLTVAGQIARSDTVHHGTDRANDQTDHAGDRS